MSNDMRADAALLARGLVQSRAKAQALIRAGLATVNGQPIEKPSLKVGEGDVLAVVGEDHPYVGRGGLKLEKALATFGIDPSGMICMDIGASTGGFTDVLLRGGAARVYAIDVGEGQLAPSLRADPRVVNMEHVNARALTADMLPERPSLAVMDVSFISIRLILPAVLGILGEGGRMVTLVKPQFEAGRAQIGKRGVVSSAVAHEAVLREVAAAVSALGWTVQGLTFSPVAGGSGNIEFLADLVPLSRQAQAVDDGVIRRIVQAAHEAVGKHGA